MVGRAVAGAYLAEALVGLRLAGEGLDDAHPGDVLLQRGGDQPEPLADAAIRARRASAEDRRGDGHQREDDERGEREAPVEQEEDDRRADENEEVLDEARDPVRDQLVQRLDVVREPRDDRTRAIALVEAEREAAEVAEEA